MRHLFHKLLHSLTVTAFGTTLYLYYYTVFCQWKWSDSETRILFLADPQIEGDAKILRQGIRGQIDLFGNDLYFRHIYTSFVSPYSLFKPAPTHVIILGDLFSSQWVSNTEFEKRVVRYKWIFGDPNREYTHQLINLTGNHDVGYSRDMTRFRVNRWEREFGKTNFVEWIPNREDESRDENESGRHYMAIINAQNVDGPAQDEGLRSETWDLLNTVAVEREKNFNVPFILLSHIPMHKPDGICADGPMIVYDQ